MNVLLAEDDKVQSRHLERHLVDRGFIVHVAFDAQTAWECAEKSPPDVIVLDLHMPGGTGLTFLKRKNGSSLLRDVPVIVTTAMEDPMVRRLAEQQGVEALFSKPVDLILLDVTLESVRARFAQRHSREKTS
ncbi:MAG TPA: response regulator [Candidatus Solibacter sp.]|nr:response regulator [Candidatus Solibacter sp.]